MCSHLILIVLRGQNLDGIPSRSPPRARVLISPRANLDKEERSEKFRSLFSENPNFNMPDEYYANGWHASKGSFNEHCNFMLKCCNKKWAPQSMRKDYLTTFSVKSWKQLLPGKQLEHSMSNCQACCQNHANLQAAFPALPRYTAPSSIVLLPHRQESHSFPCKSYMGYRCYCQGGARVATRIANQLERSCQEAQCSWEEWRADCENHC